MNLHELKIWPEFFKAVERGDKTFEVRKSDRDFNVGDLLKLREWNPKENAYTGKTAIRCITYILPGGQFGIEEGYCVLGISE